MKALVISDKQEILDCIIPYLKKNNFDVITYRWLIKALDNVEEISPDIIFLSASEYPRHWKTLASFVKSGIGGENVKVFLYDPESLSDEEKRKAGELGIEAFINSLSGEELSKIGTNSSEVLSDKKNEVPETEYELILTHPLSGRFIFGKALSLENSDNFECTADYIDDIELNQFIKFVSVYTNNTISAFSAYVKDVDKENKKILLKVQSHYEEEI